MLDETEGKDFNISSKPPIVGILREISGFNLTAVPCLSELATMSVLGKIFAASYNSTSRLKTSPGFKFSKNVFVSKLK